MREKGFYWVKRTPNASLKNPQWEVAKWDGKYWKVPSCLSKIKNEKLFSFIAPRIANPDEPIGIPFEPPVN